jgi:hypothetical protein
MLAGVACKPKEASYWEPGVAYATPTAPVYRGYRDLRGLIHSHNIHSWDACDEKPLVDGKLNQPCYQDFRGDLCQAQLDFDFLSDHTSNFNTTEFPNNQPAGSEEMDNTLLYTPSLGDKLIERGGLPVANNVEKSCGDGRQHLLMAGSEGDNLLTAGLESHAAPADATGEARDNLYDTHTDQGTFPANVPEITTAIDTMHQHGAVVFVAHPEGLTEDQLATYPLDGFEMYNMHANALFTNYGLTAVLNLVANSVPGGDLSQTPDNCNLAFLAIVNEDPRYLARWAYSASQGKKRTMIMGSDIHENALPNLFLKSMKPTWDGMRGDRYQRVMRWFSNHLLVTPNADGSWDDSNLKKTLLAGRVYGVFEALGYPVGFDYHATTAAGTVVEMGDDVQLSDQPALSVKLPTIENLNPARTPPVFTVRILVASGDTWTEVAKGSGDLAFTPTMPGTYRAEIREVPWHLQQEMGPVAKQYLSHDYVWIYSNSIYVH